MISEGSCDTEEVMAAKNPALHHRNNILKIIKIEKI